MSTGRFVRCRECGGGGPSEHELVDPSAVPMSDGDDSTPIPVGWVLLWPLVIGAGGLLYWAVF